jgi:hypothetical protein
MEVANTIAYYNTAKIMAIKKFYGTSHRLLQKRHMLLALATNIRLGWNGSGKHYSLLQKL